MSYIWNEFNIKTFPADTIVYRDGRFCPDLSTLVAPGVIRDKGVHPVHIIYVGEIDGENTLPIEIAGDDIDVFLSVDVDIKKPAFFNIFVKNTGKNSTLRGHVLLKNSSELTCDITAHQGAAHNGVLIKTKLLAGGASRTTLRGVAEIAPGAVGAMSDIGFSAMAEDGAKITFTPAQRIRAVPKSAEHSAGIYYAGMEKIEYLRGGGLSGAEVNAALREAFVNDNPLF